MNVVRVETTIKGGLPVVAESVVFSGRGETIIDMNDIKVYWSSGKEVTHNVYCSISDADWNKLKDELFESFREGSS